MNKYSIAFFFVLIGLGCSKEATPIEDEVLTNIETQTPESPIAAPVVPESIPNNPWWNDVVFYEIFVRSFHDSNGDGIGDIQGIIDKLDYLNDGNPATSSDLGVTGLWLMPIFPSESYHGYDVTNYRNINSDYGTLDDFKRLLTEAHNRGIKVIIDFVGNHTSDQHPWFTASASSQENKRDWYQWQDSPPNYNGPWGQNVWHERNNAYYYGLFWGGMPDLNFRNIEVTNEIKDISRFWADEVGVDGFRIDAVKHWVEEGSNQENTTSTLNWWRDFYAFQKSISPSLMTVGEVWTTTQNILPYTDNRLDYCFEFDLAENIINSINAQSAARLKQKVNQITSNYAYSQYGTFLTNHDQNRVFNRLGSSIPRAKLAASILLSLPGVPYLYYGEEIAMKGQKPDENIRLPMQWNTSANAGFTTGTPWISRNVNSSEFNVATMQEEDNSLWNHYRNWIQIRKQNTAFRAGRYKGLGSNLNSIFAFLRIDLLEDQTVLVLHNLSAQNQSDLNINTLSSDLPSGEYNLINLSSSDTLGTLSFDSNGGFNATLTGLSLEPYMSLAIQLQKK
jgi:glycosidase